jgi:alpha-galactosidase
MTLRPAATAFIKSKGMKFGIYGAAGQTTCAGKAGGLYHEYLDAQTYADWGAEYLKVSTIVTFSSAHACCALCCALC